MDSSERTLRRRRCAQADGMPYTAIRMTVDIAQCTQVVEEHSWLPPLRVLRRNSSNKSKPRSTAGSAIFAITAPAAIPSRLRSNAAPVATPIVVIAMDLRNVPFRVSKNPFESWREFKNSVDIPISSPPSAILTACRRSEGWIMGLNSNSSRPHAFSRTWRR
jgi:hypothetical protein